MKKIIILMIAVMMLVPVLLGLSGRNTPKLKSKINPEKIKYLETETDTVKECELEEYLVGVLAAEMPAEYHIEALKAQAVAARSYIVSRLETENPEHPDAVVCDNPDHCKAHLDESAAKSRWGEEKSDGYWKKLKSAVDKTKGEYMICEDRVVEAFFFARSSGRTENSEDVWGEARPYLKSVDSVEDKTHPEFESAAEFKNKEARQILWGLNNNIKQGDNALAIGNITRTAGGSIASLEIDGQIFTGKDIRSAFGLKSANFVISTNSEKASFRVFGYGHGVGMSQFGAHCMAESGEKYTEILSHYYTNIQIINL